MGTQEDYHELNNRENKAILQQLIEDCDDDDTSKIIGCYTIGASDKDIRSKLNSFNKPALEKTAHFLKINSEGRKKQELQIDIIMKLESLLREPCPACGEYYNILLNENPFFECIKCHQGCHNPCFEEMYQIMNTMQDGLTNSFHFMCVSCSEFNKLSKPVIESKKHPNISQTSVKTPSGEHDTSIEEEDDVLTPGQPPRRPGTPPPSQPSQNPSQPRQNPSQPNLNPSQPDGNPSQPNENPRQPYENPRQPNENPQEPKVPICPTYKWGRCPNYEKCQYRHPPRCWNWLSDGKCKHKKCKYHHPQLCRRSLSERKCFNETCKYFHVSKTVRRNIEEEQLRNSLNQKTYEGQRNEHPKEPSDKPTSQSNKTTLAHSDKNQDHINNPPTETQPVKSQEEPILNTNNVTFLVHTIRDLLREDLKKELTDIKTQLSYVHLMQNMLNRPIQLPVSVNQKPTVQPTQQNLLSQVQPSVPQMQTPNTQTFQTTQQLLMPNLQ